MDAITRSYERGIMMGKVKDLTGKRFDKLTVIKQVGVSKNRYAKWECVCDCGRTVIRTTDVLNRKTRHSCGCLNDNNLARMSNGNITHGMTGTRLYRVYKGMRDRCYYPNSDRYNAYGGRGIRICKEWLEDKNKFFEWALQNGYRDDLTIERIDVNGDYCPENCKWIPMSEQYKNKQSNYHRLPNAYNAERGGKNE